MHFWGILVSIRTTRKTRTIRVFRQKVFDIRASTIPTRIGNPNGDEYCHFFCQYLSSDGQNNFSSI